ncbi:radical SAM protein [bacterium]|nr:MAG: radical SAM protein [bacterium]
MRNNPYIAKRAINEASLRKANVPFLSRFDIELTERCNNNCIHCCINLSADNVNAREKELSTGRIKIILKEAASLGCLRVRFTGGEPLLREDFEELYIFARKLGLKVLIFSNATLLTPHLAELFSRILPLEKIEITLYGMKKSSYEAITRVNGSFAAAWRGISLLLDHKIPFVVKGALLPGNKDEIKEFEKWAGTIPWADKSPPYSMFFDLRCRRDKGKNRSIKNLRLSPEEGLKFLTRSKDKYVKEMKEFCSKFMRLSGDKLFTCGSGSDGGCVDAYGYFYPCMMLKHPDTGYDLKKGSLKDALTGFFPKLREIRSTNPEYLKRCAKCFLKGLCEQCPAKSWIEHGNLDTPVEYLCEIAHVQARFLALVKDDEMAWEVKDWGGRIKKFTRGCNHGTKS